MEYYLDIRNLHISTLGFVVALMVDHKHMAVYMAVHIQYMVII